MKYSFLLILYFLISIIMHAQGTDGSYPVIGKELPPFSLKEVHYSSLSEISSKKLLGKPYVLDFFSSGCTACFASFPHINELNKTFQSQLKYFLIGLPDKYIRKSYEKFREKFDLQMIVAYDSVIFKRYKIQAVPRIIWVDENGIVKAITGTQEMNEDNIKDFLSGKKLNVKDYSVDGQEYLRSSFDLTKPYLLYGNGGDDSTFLFRSLLAKWTLNTTQSVIDNVDNNIRYNLPVQLIGATVPELYRFAYFGKGEWATSDTSMLGKYFHDPLLEIKDTSLFQYDYATAKNIFSYSQIFPQTQMNKSHILKTMQRDLQTYFSYEASVEMRKMPYWKLIQINPQDSSLKTKGGTRKIQSNFSNFEATNISVWLLIDDIRHYLGLSQYILDGTNISYNIDIDFEAAKTDFDDVRKALQKNGLDLVKGEKEMKVLVIRDAKIE